MLGVGTDLPSNIKGLLELPRDCEGASILRQAYARLGLAVLTQFQFDHQDEELAGLRNQSAQLDTLVSTLAERDARLFSLKFRNRRTRVRAENIRGKNHCIHCTHCFRGTRRRELNIMSQSDSPCLDAALAYARAG